MDVHSTLLICINRRKHEEVEISNEKILRAKQDWHMLATLSITQVLNRIKKRLEKFTLDAHMYPIN